jgi:hypothetical protein
MSTTRDGGRIEGMKKYMKIRLHGGGSYLQPLDKIHEAIDNELCDIQIGDTITLDFELVEMDDEEYESLVEFDGH